MYNYSGRIHQNRLDMKGKIIMLLLVLGALSADAQKYTTAIGGRIGSGIGLTVQQKLWKKTTLEVILSQRFKTDEILLTGLLERHQGLLGKRLNFYAGAGFHTGWNAGLEETRSIIGISGIAGLEFTIARFNLSWDFKPAIHIQGGEQLFNPQTAVSLRYVFIKHKRKKRKINWKFWQKDNNKKKGKK